MAIKKFTIKIILDLIHVVGLKFVPSKYMVINHSDIFTQMLKKNKKQNYKHQICQ